MPSRSSGLARQPWRMVSIAPHSWSGRSASVGAAVAVMSSSVALVGLDQLAVGGDGGLRLGMCALRDGAAAVEVQHLVGEGDRRRAGGDDDRGDPAELVTEAGEDARLGCRIEAGRRVVEQQHRGRRTRGPGQRDPLALSAAQRHAPLADHGVGAVAGISPRKLVTWARSMACSTSAAEAVPARSTLLRIESANRKGSWNTMHGSSSTTSIVP